jgi:hypothetical protein
MQTRKLAYATPFVMIGAFVTSWIVTQGFLFGMLVGIGWAAIGVASKFAHRPWKDAGGSWRSGETGYKTTPKSAYSYLLSLGGSVIAFTLLQGNTIITQIVPWFLNAPVGYQLLSIGAFHGIGYYLTR